VIELKNIILRRVSIFEFSHSQGHKPTLAVVADKSSQVQKRTPVEQERATPEALEAFLKAEVDKWGRIIKEAGIEPQ
jgi:hypothetical protein